MNIDDINSSLNQLWASTITQTILDLNEPSVEFRIVKVEDDHQSTLYRIRCDGLVNIEYSTNPTHWNYAELTAAVAKVSTYGEKECVLLDLEIWSDEMTIKCMSVKVEKTAGDET